MDLGMVGMGRMGASMAHRLVQAGHCVVAYDQNPDAVRQAEQAGAVAAASLADLVGQLPLPRAVWVMLPAGAATERTIEALVPLLSPDDTIVDGGNSWYKDSMRRAERLRERGLHFLDVGTSGGIWGLRAGYSLMVGGEREVFARLEPLLQALAPGPDQGYGYVGPSGTGHFVKMVHNGIEYGAMQAYAEGFALLQAKPEFGLDLAQVAEIWRHGSVVRSWLLDLIAAALAQDPELRDLRAYVEDSGEGRWTVFEAIELNVPAPVITLALQQRLRSRQEEPFAERLLAALREQFGGHPVRRRADGSPHPTPAGGASAAP
ncbi:MAG: decarboxylating 6-phosphogluconate dehydrogenase [Chloroflexi bacterium]|nr:decarboxylating 6-phosphogluconate dehydrogenase [Chloroflexota bacterium]